MFTTPTVFERNRGFSSEESEALGDEARQARLRDRELSDRLGGPSLQGTVASSGYLHELGRRPRLPAALERTLVADAKGGDRRARAQLVEAFLPAIAAVARVYRGRAQIERAELMQEGVVGLLRALERFDADRGVPFWGYAAWWVRQAMQQLVAELARPVVLSDHALRQLAELREVHSAHVRRNGREPSAQELAAASGIDAEDVDNLLATERPARSLEAPAGGDEEGVGSFRRAASRPARGGRVRARSRAGHGGRATRPPQRAERARAPHTVRPLRRRRAGAEPARDRSAAGPQRRAGATARAAGGRQAACGGRG